MDLINYEDYNDRKKTGFSRFTYPLYLVLAFLLGMMIAVWLLSSKLVRIRHDSSDKFNEVLTYLERMYVDSVNTNELTEMAISSMLQQLDPHSTYANAQENKEVMESLDGAFEGVGIQFSLMNDTVMVIATISGGPSAKVGIQAGDRIVTVNDSVIAGVNIQNEDVMHLLRGKKNSKVKVGIKRPGFDKLYHYEITRDKIPTYTVDVSYMIDQQTGYVKINQFGKNTGKEFAEALVKLNGKGMRKLILDLRGNPGGYLESCIEVCDELLSKGEMIVYTEGLHIPTDKVRATSYGHFEQGTLVVLIDDFSASASEIVAGAVQDNDRGTVIGRRSFGKGLVQQQIDFSDKSSMRLTVARYHTPSGRCIQKTYEKGTDAYNFELYDRFLHGEMDSRDSIKENKNLIYKTKMGRTVYGGGGIMPDIFVPLDRDSLLTDCYELLNSGKLYPFAFHYVTENKKSLQQHYPDAESFVKNMKITDQVMQQFWNFHQKENKKQKPVLSPESEKELKLWLKALIGRDLYQDEAFYPVINLSDKTIQEAIKIK